MTEDQQLRRVARALAQASQASGLPGFNALEVLVREASSREQLNAAAAMVQSLAESTLAKAMMDGSPAGPLRALVGAARALFMATTEGARRTGQVASWIGQAQAALAAGPEVVG
jgi:hypothetical protein